MADFAHPEMLIETEELAARLGEPNLVIVDNDVFPMYQRAHIPGAVGNRGDHYFKADADRRFLAGPDEFAAMMSALGIGDDTEVVGYDASGSLYATRLWWSMKYYGHPGARILNGGWNKWLAEGRPVTMEEPKITPATFTPRATDESIYAGAEYIMANLARRDFVVLDVRSDGEWEGTNSRGNKRVGHIPGAVHLEWFAAVSSDLKDRRQKSPDELKAMFEAIGVTPDKEVVTMCQGGIRASQSMATLHMLGYDRVRNYDGSALDWSNRDDTPLE
jgi:thiosulfate/3-mercaptopyruvate sulfurtransferase